MLDRGVGVNAVAEWIGDTSKKMVTDPYARLMPNGDDLGRQAIDGAWSAMLDGRISAARQRNLR